MSEIRIVPAGDAALLVELPPRIDPETSGRVIALAEALRERCGGTLRDVVVGYCSLTVYFDALEMDAAWLESEIRTLAEDYTPERETPDDAAVIEVPACYEGEYGPDLEAVAEFAHATPQDTIAIHTGTIYRVYVVGFVPGFPYMASVDPRLAVPRRATPRTRVPAGSVALAAGQTGIYPTESPGGWHLIGRTRVKPYDAARDQPFLFKPGDRVRFRAIDRAEFESAS